MLRSSDRGDYSFSGQQQLRECMSFFFLSVNFVRVFIILGTSSWVQSRQIACESVCWQQSSVHVPELYASVQKEDLCSILENTSIFIVWYW